MSIARDFGKISLLGYFPDSFGNVGQMPQILKQAGMKAIAFGRGVKPTGMNNSISEGEDYSSQFSEMYWQSPDGSTLPAILFANWYHNGYEMPADGNREYWDRVLSNTEKHASTKELLLMNGCEHQPGQCDLSAALEKAREYYHLRTEWTMLGNGQQGVPQLRFAVPLGYEPETYRYAIPYGMIDRTPLAQDVPATGLGCAMPKNGDSALCLMCDTKYGFRGDREGLSVNLIRSSYEPDPYPEVGTHMIHIAVGACDTDKHNLALLREQFIHPIITRTCASGPRTEEASKSLIGLDGGILSSVKEAEDGNGWIVRVYNPSEKESAMKLWFTDTKCKVYCCDFLENDLELLSVKDGEIVEYMLNGNEICSFRMIME